MISFLYYTIFFTHSFTFPFTTATDSSTSTQMSCTAEIDDMCTHGKFNAWTYVYLAAMLVSLIVVIVFSYLLAMQFFKIRK